MPLLTKIIQIPNDEVRLSKTEKDLLMSFIESL